MGHAIRYSTHVAVLRNFRYFRKCLYFQPQIDYNMAFLLYMLETPFTKPHLVVLFDFICHCDKEYTCPATKPKPVGLIVSVFK